MFQTYIQICILFKIQYLIFLHDFLITVDSKAVRHVLAAIPVASINGMESVWHECLAPNMERTDLTDGRTDKMVGGGRES